MAIPKGYRDNFKTLLRAAADDSLALVESTDVASGEPRFLVCAIGRGNAGEYLITPFGHLCNGNPFEEYTDPIVALDASEPNDPAETAQ